MRSFGIDYAEAARDIKTASTKAAVLADKYGTHNDADTVKSGAEGAAAGAATGAAVAVGVATATGAASGSAAGPFGAAIGAVVGLIIGLLGGPPSPPPWLDPNIIGSFAFSVITTGAIRGLPPWDIAPGLTNGTPVPIYGLSLDTSSPMANNLVQEILMNRRDIAIVNSDGTMPKEVEACCFMLAQIWGACLVNGLSTGSVDAAQVFNLGDLGEQLFSAVRYAMQRKIETLPPPPVFSSVSKGQAAMATLNVPSSFVKRVASTMSGKAATQTLQTLDSSQWVIGSAVAAGAAVGTWFLTKFILRKII